MTDLNPIYPRLSSGDIIKLFTYFFGLVYTTGLREGGFAVGVEGEN